ncbi:methyltransferase [Alteribacillus sp. JSM 102045]|uniref:methyltransferase n=1 Tax=Alteribacillus sp. JSM 102045 TaxID=1562101 RepID=UPI0035BF776A
MKRFENTDVVIQHGDFQECHLTGNPFDMVIMNNVLYYFSLEKRQALFHQVSSSMNKGGTLIVISPVHAAEYGKAFSAAFNSFMSAHKNLFQLPSSKEIKQYGKKQA